MANTHKIRLTIDNSSAMASAEAFTKKSKEVEAAWLSAGKAAESALKKIGAQLGSAGGGVDALTGKITAQGAALRANATDAGKLATSLKGVGQGTATITTTTTKLGRLGSTLGTVNTQARQTAGGLRGVGTAAIGVGSNFQQATGHSDAMGSSFGRLAIAGMAIGGVLKIVGELGKALKEAREHAEGLADVSLGRRDKARQLASLMGESGPNDRVMARISGISLHSGMSHDDSRAFLQEFEGSIPAGVEKGHIKEEQKRDVAKAVALSARRLGLDAKTAGDMAGTIAKDVDLNAQVDKNGKKMTAAQAMTTQLEATAYGLNEGRGDISVLARGEVATAAKDVPAGRMRSRSDVGAFVGVGSIAGAKSGASAGTFTMWADRGLNRATGKEADFLKKTGIADERYDEDKIKKLKEVLAAERAKAPNPARFDPNAFLAKQGFGSEQDRMAMVGFSENYGVLAHRLEKSRAIASDPSFVEGKNRAFGQDKAQQMAVAKARAEHAEMTQGAKTEDLRIARVDAAAKLENMGLLNRADQKVADAISGGFGVKEWAGLPSEKQNRIDDEVRRSLEVRVKNAGIDVKDLRYPSGAANAGGLMIQSTLDALRAKGIGPLGESGGMEAEAENADVSPAIRAAREKAKLPAVRAPAAGKPLAFGRGGRGAFVDGLPAGRGGWDVAGRGGNGQAGSAQGGGDDPQMTAQNALLARMVAATERPEPRARPMPIPHPIGRQEGMYRA